MTFIVATNVIASRPPECRPTGTPHARAKRMAGRQGLERGPILGYWALPSTFAKQVFWSEHSFYEKHRTPAKSKMATTGPQNGQLGLERGQILGFWNFWSACVK